MGSIGKVRQGLIDGEAVTTNSLSAGCVTTIKIADLNVTTPKIALSAVTVNNLALTAVQTRHLGPLVVTTPKIAPVSITTDKIALSAITTELMALTAIQTRHIDVSAVTWEKMAADSVRTINIQLSAITNDLMALSSVQTRHIEISAVTQEKLAVEAVAIQNVHPTTSVLFSFRNAIINGAMNVAQRAVSAAVGSNYPRYTTVDRFFSFQEGQVDVTTRRESVSTWQPGLSGFQSCLRWGRVPGGTASGRLVLGQVVESIHSVPFQNSPACLSFFARCGTTFSSENSALNVKLYTGAGEDQLATSMLSASWTNGLTAINANAILEPTNTTQGAVYNAIDGISNAAHTGSLPIRFMTQKRAIPALPTVGGSVAVYSTNTSAINRIYDAQNATDYVASYIYVGRNGFTATCTTSVAAAYTLLGHYVAECEFI